MPDEHESGRVMFSDWITDHAGGAVDLELTALLAEVTEAVAHHGAAGSVSLTVKVAPAGSGGRTVVTACSTSAKPPAPAPECSIFYVGEGGTLHRNDPYQGSLLAGARVVDHSTGEIRSIDTEGNTE